MRLVFVAWLGAGAGNLGFFGALLNDVRRRASISAFSALPDLPALRTGDILVGHSAGCSGACARNATGRASSPSIPSRASVSIRRGAAASSPPRCAPCASRSSATRKAAPMPSAARSGSRPPPGAAQKERLMEGTRSVAGFRCDALRGAPPWLVLGAQDDFLAPAAAARDLARISGAALALHAHGGHGLPWTAPAFCASHIRDFVRRCV